MNDQQHSQLLPQLLKAGAAHAPHYEPVSNSDHLPMTLCAMSGLGADDTGLRRFADDYSQRLHRWSDGTRVEDWSDGLGDAEAYGDLIRWFEAALAGTSRQSGSLQEVIDPVLEVTLPGISLDAFHPVIRLGYALEFDALKLAPAELAAALAYVVTVHREMPVSLDEIEVQGVIESQVSRGPVRLKASRFSGQMLELVARGDYPLGSAADLDQLAALALDVYRGTRNFFALHLVTSTQALRQICEQMSPDNRRLAIASQTSAILGAHLALGSPAFDEVQPVPGALDPEHALKYVWSCVSEYRATGRDIYLEEAAAFRSRGRVPAWVSLPGD